LTQGVDWTHPDLDNNIWNNSAEIAGNGVDDDGNGYIDDTRGWDFINNDNDPYDDNSHGTHVAGIAAAESNNGIGITGIAWNAKILPVKMLQSSGAGNSDNLALAINYAAAMGATVINMSLGSYGESQTVKIALENAYGTAVLVAAAGNNGYSIDPPFSSPLFPACYGFVIGVEATTNTGALARFSNFDPSGPSAVGNLFGHNYEIKAPGADIYSTLPGGGYHSLNGTSMASPIVAGAVSLMKSFNPSQSTEILFARLIQSSTNGILDIRKSLDYTITPDLQMLNYTLVDTLPGCDKDGKADAGETVEIYFSVKNAGGQADSVWSKLRFADFEDTTTATIVDSVGYIGSISAYGTLTGKSDPIRVTIASDVANNRDIKLEYEIGAANQNSIKDELVINVTNGEELGGYYDHNVYLKANKLYLGTQTIVIAANDTLFIGPGVRLLMADKKALNVKGTIIAKGKPDSLIYFSAINNGWGSLTLKSGIVDYAVIEKLSGTTFGIHYSSEATFNNCIIKDNSVDELLTSNTMAQYNYCNIVNNITWIREINKINLYHCNIMNNKNLNQNATSLFCTSNSGWDITGCNIFNNLRFNLSAYAGENNIVELTSDTYYGSKNLDYIKTTTKDFFYNGALDIMHYQNWAKKADSLAHGIVWKVAINNKNPMDFQIDPIGTGMVKFDVYFNRAMDIDYQPLLSFGVREPYTQHLVLENSSWSADSTIWTAYCNIGLETGDGIQTVRVANARDDERFEIPIENLRFKFVIQAAGSASVDFQATAGIGKVDLEWPGAKTDDILGYNMYRFHNLTDSTFSDTLMINNRLVTDSTYTDFNVIPDTTYHYLYRIVGTDMIASDFSKSVVATPFNATAGDANGDQSVNVLDVTSLVNYLLNLNPLPFLISAADANHDGAINVLDIVKVINTIMGKSYFTAKTRDVANAGLIINSDRVEITNGSDVAALELHLVGQNLSNQTRLIAGDALTGMEFSYSITADTINVVIYNFGNNTLSANGVLFKIEKGGIVSLKKAVFSDNTGNEIASGVEENINLIPEKFFLANNYPNPFNPVTTISYGLAEQSDMTLSIYNLQGQLVYTLSEKDKKPGYYKFRWQGDRFTSGVYIYQLKAGANISSKKMILVK